MDSDEGGDPPCWAHRFEGTAWQPEQLELAELLRELADAVVIADADGTIAFWNNAAVRLFGWSPEEAIGRSLDLIIPERLRDRHWLGFQSVMRTGTTSYAGKLLEVPALRRDGSPLSISFTVTLLRHPDGSPKGIAAVLRDETERWRERRTMRDELDRLRGAASS
jgi:PAS domain S-box-containing protein